MPNDEKRQHTRIKTRIPLEYKNLRKTIKDVKGVLAKDLSEGGVRFTANEFLSLANRLVITINIPTAAREIKAITKIAWIKKLPSGDLYEIGNQFLEISKDDKEEVAKYVKTVIEMNVSMQPPLYPAVTTP